MCPRPDDGGGRGRAAAGAEHDPGRGARHSPRLRDHLLLVRHLLCLLGPEIQFLTATASNLPRMPCVNIDRKVSDDEECDLFGR